MKKCFLNMLFGYRLKIYLGLLLVVLTEQINLKHRHVSFLTRQNAKHNTSLTSKNIKWEKMLALLKRNGVRIFCCGGGGGSCCGQSKWPQNGNFVRTNGHLGGTLSVDLLLHRALRVRKMIVALCCCPHRHYKIFEFATILERALCNIASGNKNYRCFVLAYQGRSQLFD